MSNSLRAHGLQHTRPPCPSPTPRVDSNSCPLSRWCHPTISSSVVSFSSCLQSCPTSESFQISQLFASGGQSIGVSASASVLPINIQAWFPFQDGLVRSPCSPRDSWQAAILFQGLTGGCQNICWVFSHLKSCLRLGDLLLRRLSHMDGKLVPIFGSKSWFCSIWTFPRSVDLECP